MAIVQLVVPDTMLSDFYTSIGAFPHPAWSVEEQTKWLQIAHLEPFLLNTLLSAGDQARRNRVHDEVSSRVSSERAVLETAIKEYLDERQKELPKVSKSVEEGELVVQSK